MAEAIVLSAVSKSYGRKRAVQALDLTVPQGSVYGFLGPNGSGKTTTIRMIVNILFPDDGSVQVLGKKAGAETRDYIGYLPEERGLYPRMKVREVLEFFGRLRGVPSDEVKRRVQFWLKRIELESVGEKKVDELSKGMQQKIQFVAAVIADPPVLILDEPSSGLDPGNANLLKEILLELRAAGKTVLFSTHRMEEAERLCDYVCLIHEGVKVLDGKLAEVRAAQGKSAARVDYKGDTQILRAAPGVTRVEDYGNYAELRIAPGTSAPELVRYLSQRLDLTRFELMEPSLTEIFLEKTGFSAPQPARGASAL